MRQDTLEVILPDVSEADILRFMHMWGSRFLFSAAAAAKWWSHCHDCMISYIASFCPTLNALHFYIIWGNVWRESLKKLQLVRMGMGQGWQDDKNFSCSISVNQQISLVYLYIQNRCGIWLVHICIFPRILLPILLHSRSHQGRNTLHFKMMQQFIRHSTCSSMVKKYNFTYKFLRTLLISLQM